jgi:nucleoside-diphosphate-sugar epimerase/predicted dehydrogenase
MSTRPLPAGVLKVGIVGAGLNSDYHVNFSKAYPGAAIVGVADANMSRAEACAATHGIPRAFGSAADLLKLAAPDVVHVVTPPMTHFAVVREVLEAGCHALVEKPLALNGGEAGALYEIADRHGVRLCPMHNHLFDPCMRRADALIRSGELGAVVNVESYYGLNTNIPAFRDYPQPNVLPWLYGLPGGVYQDFLPHPLYVLLEYTGAPRNMTVMYRSNGTLPQRLPDEIRILVDGEKAFGTVTFSFAAKPHLHFVRVYGTRMMVEADFNNMTAIAHPVSSLPKAAQKATYNLDESWQRTKSTVTNMAQFVTGRLKPYHGMRNLIHQFYGAVISGGPLPVTKDRALLVVNTMDDIFARLKFAPLKHDPIVPQRSVKPSKKRVLVTGGSGFVGKRLVRRLIADGYAVRVLARKLANVEPLAGLGAEVFWGDVADLESFDRAFAGCDAILHLAAGTSGSVRDSQSGTIEGTRNLLELCRRHQPAKLVYVSSCSVYGVADYRDKGPVPETAPLERHPERRGSYSAAKQEAERMVADYVKAGGGPVVTLRPGTIYGADSDLYTAMMGFSIGSKYIVIGTGGFVLPLVYVDNVVDALVRCLDATEADNEIFNLVDPERLTKREYMDRIIRRVDPDARVFYLPYSILYAATWIQEIAFGLMRRRPVLTRYRLTSSQKNIVYDARKIAGRLGWTAPVKLQQAIEEIVRARLSRPEEPSFAQMTVSGESLEGAGSTDAAKREAQACG